MDFVLFFNSDIFKWGILPLLIFLSRICDVTLGTIRIIFVSRENKIAAPILGFFEILIWLIAISQIMKNLDNFLCYIAYAAGFATGNFVGIHIEEKLAMGILIVKVILTKDECRLKERLITAGYGVTVIDAHGANTEVKIVYTVIKRKDLGSVLQIINKCNTHAFYSVEDARTAYQGVFPKNRKYGGSGVFGFLRSAFSVREDSKRK
jgi:uncharacterized protein YebE (UPF0316 family)